MLCYHTEPYATYVAATPEGDSSSRSEGKMVATEQQARSLSLELVERASSLDSRPAAVKFVFDVLQRGVGFDTGILFSFEGAPPITVHKTHQHMDHWRERAENYLLDLAPMYDAARQLGDVICDQDVFSANERDSLGIYAEYFRPLGVGAVLALFIRCGDVITQLLSVARYGRGASFSVRELEVVRALRSAVSVTTRLLPGVPPPAWNRPQPPEWTPTAPLTARERQIVALLCRGLRNHEIATVCGTSANTVRNQLAAIFRKCEVTTRAELVAHASRLL